MEFVDLGWKNQMGNTPLGFLPSDLAGLKLWTRFNSGITVTGSGVSQWDDVSGNGNHLTQSADTSRPSKEADGSILFDGVDNFLRATFTLVQPETIYLLCKQVTWTANDTIFDGIVTNTGRLYQVSSSPILLCNAGAPGISTPDLTLNTYAAMCVLFDEANSTNLIQINSSTSAVDTAFGTEGMGGFTLANDSGGARYSNIQVKECIVFSEAHDAATRLQVINYLAGVGGLAV